MDKVLQRFGMDNAKVVLVPLVQNFKLSVAMSFVIDGGMVEMSKFPYAQVVVCLIYSIVCIRPISLML